LDIVPNPDLTVAAGQDLCANGVQFGDIGVLLFSVPGITQTASQTLYIVGTFSPAAQRGDHLQLIVKMVAVAILWAAALAQRSSAVASR
jgi:hypothetical protein